MELGLPVAAIEGVEHVTNGLFLARQEDGHQVGAIAVWQFDGLIEVVLCIAELFVHFMHHGHVRASTKGLILSLLYFKRVTPHTFEI